MILQFHLGPMPVRIRIEHTWASSNKDHRLLIRESIIDDLKVSNLEETRQLKERPRLTNGFVSISHCPIIGGYASGLHRMGFDLEDPKRINEKVITRVSSQDEIKQSPKINFLWLAKEASFKALPEKSQPAGPGMLRISKWQQSDDQTFLFSVVADFHGQPSHIGQGLVLDQDDYLLSVCSFLEPQL